MNNILVTGHRQSVQKASMNYITSKCSHQPNYTVTGEASLGRGVLWLVLSFLLCLSWCVVKHYLHVLHLCCVCVTASLLLSCCLLFAVTFIIATGDAQQPAEAAAGWAV